MAEKAFCMISAEAGKAVAVRDQLRLLAGVQSADTIMGDVDVIAVVTAPDLTGITRLVLTSIQPINGVKDTQTCLVVNP